VAWGKDRGVVAVKAVLVMDLVDNVYVPVVDIAYPIKEGFRVIRESAPNAVQ
jgi:hypothetical protein